MANESESRKLNDLRVVDLRQELEKRDLDKTGVKAVLLERLQQALTQEGHDPETYIFEPPSEVKRTPGKGKNEDDKGEEDEDAQHSDQDKENKAIDKDTPKNEDKDQKESSDNATKDTNETDKATKGSSEADKTTKGSSEADKTTKCSSEDGEPIKDQASKAEATEPAAKKDLPASQNKNDVKDITNESKKKTEIKSSSSDEKPKTDLEDQNKSNEKPSGKGDETKPQSQSQEESKVEPAKSGEVSAGGDAGKKTSGKTGSGETPAKTNVSSSKEEKTTDANGIIDNEDSINLTIGEDEAKMLADEEDSSQEKEQKDESHGSAGHKKSSAAEKSQDKTNQEKMDGKSSTVGEKAAKDDKSKKVAATVGGGSSRNLWVSGLATTTRATDLKQVFSKYGKVIGAKVVTNARTPGARCYGYVTMSNPDDANKAVQFLHHTELHGRLISVEKAKGDSTGPPKRNEPAKVESPVKKVEEKKKEPIVRKVDPKKEENIVPPGTEGDLKEPEAPGTEKDAAEAKGEAAKDGHKGREVIRSAERPEKRPRSVGSNQRSRGGSPVLTFDKIKEERERQRLRERERLLREEERRRETERMRQREIDRKQREEFERLDREKKKLKMERERLLREKDELLKLKSERQRLERERQKLEREKLEKEKEELERLKRQNMRLEEEARRKRSLSASREYESRKRPAPDSRYVGHSSTQSRYPDSRSSEYKKESSHKSTRELAVPPRRPGFEPEPSRRMVTSVPPSRESWPPKERESGRYERTSVNSSSFRDDSISSRTKPSESRHVRERYADGPKSDRFVERSDSWHGGGSAGGGGPMKTFSSRETWVSGDRKQDVTEPWARPSTNSSRWPLSSTSVGMGNRSGPQGSISNAIFTANNSQGLPGMNMGMSMGSFSGGDRFDAYKQPYFKGQ